MQWTTNQWKVAYVEEIRVKYQLYEGKRDLKVLTRPPVDLILLSVPRFCHFPISFIDYKYERKYLFLVVLF